ncbi:MAG TPA: XrtA/PEP-CTERM system TPR-repeat protein PrsT, partial [Steroidobacteraceae bacterium]|nr:XrtA/PEP-CTERM system TPR-repeat protein PrsT [Steroidobacteraceae bacterium]
MSTYSAIRNSKSRPLVRAALLVGLLSASSLSTVAYGALPAAGGDLTLDDRTTKLVSDAEVALRNGNLNLALIHLKNAVRFAPNNGAVRAQLGLALLQSGDAATAERELRQARMDNGPENVIVPGILRAMLTRGRNQELLAEFREPPPQDQTAAEVLRARAVALQALGRTAEANAAADRALQLGRVPASLIARARLAQRQSDFTLAERLIDETIRLQPENIELLIMKISVLKERGETQRAVPVAEDLVRRYPNSAAARLSRIDILLALKQDAKAKQDIDFLSKQSPNSPMVTYLQALLTARANDYKAAWQQMQRLPPEFVQLQPEFAMAIAQVGINSDNLESAGAILTTLISRHPEVTRARFQLALLRLRQRSPNAAIAAMGQLANSDNAEAQAILAQAYLQLRRFDDAIGALEGALASGNGSDLLKRQLAFSQLQVGNSEEAIEELRKVVASNPGDAESVAPLIAVLVRERMFDDALKIADQMAKAVEKSPMPSFYRGQILVVRGDLPQAATAFGQSLTIDPKFVPALYYNANVALARGNSELATRNLREIIGISPTNVLSYIRLAEIALSRDQEREAVAFLEQAIKAAPDSTAPRLAMINYQISRQDYQDALASVDALLQISPNNPEGLAFRGQIQLATGSKTQAIATFRALAASNPSSAAAQILLVGALRANQDASGAEVALRNAINLAPASVQVRSAATVFLIAQNKNDDALATARD